MAIPGEFRINEEIRAKAVRLIDDEGKQLGILPIEQAKQAAEEKGVDLVEVARDADPPVCRLMDYGKFKYEQRKKVQIAKKKQKVVHVKEIRLRSITDEHDMMIKVNHAKEFLLHGDKVLVTMFFRGREMAHTDIGRAHMEKFVKELEAVGKIEKPLTMEGSRMYLVAMPK
jgi:translation initiation factor IF-3